MKFGADEIRGELNVVKQRFRRDGEFVEFQSQLYVTFLQRGVFIDYGVPESLGDVRRA